MESDDELQSHSSFWHAPRALTLIALSILTIAVAGIGYVQPRLWFSPGTPAPAAKAPAAYQLGAVDFVTPATGWVVMELSHRDFQVLRTADAGDTWTRQLAGSAGAIGEYVRFFDIDSGVLVQLGPQASLYQTSDGGTTWKSKPLTQGRGYIWSADFIDPRHGWILASAATEGQSLYRTADGGTTWTNLGNPVLYSDWAYRVLFSNATDGWLYSESTGPYAYKTTNAGTTWSRIPLPAPVGGWPSVQGGSISAGEFFVAAHPTQGAGVMTTVIGVAQHNGRLRVGGVLLGYPPLRVSTYDGGRPVTDIYTEVSPYRYSTIERINPGPYVHTLPPNQFQMSSVDGGLSWVGVVPPSPHGAVGYIDAHHWWWIGSGARATSSDAGSTWTDIRGAGVPQPLPGSLQFIDADHAWFGGMAGPRPLVETTDDGGIHWRMVLLPAIRP
jgi:photosystem II stability/assembly factor-like uncharacterized protein